VRSRIWKVIVLFAVGASAGLAEIGLATIRFGARFPTLDKYIVGLAANSLYWGFIALAVGGLWRATVGRRSGRWAARLAPPAEAWVLALPGLVLTLGVMLLRLPGGAISVRGVAAAGGILLAYFAGAWLVGLLLNRVAVLKRIAAVYAVGATAAAYLIFLGGWLWPLLHRPARVDPRPCVVVVVVDSLRASELGCYGGKAVTPNADAFARRGVRFERCMTPVPWTLPASASIFTGLYPQQHGVTDVDRRIPAALETLPEAFAAAGYRTGVFAANHFVSPSFGFNAGCDTIDADGSRAYLSPATLLGRADYVLSPNGQAKRTAADINFWAGRWVARGDRRPFFLYLHYMEPHYPYVPRSYRGGFLRAGEPVYQPEVLALHRYAARGVPFPMTPARRADLHRRYREEISEWDAAFGRLLRRLAAAGKGRRVIIVLTADHGQEFGEHGSYYHGTTVYDEVSRVPLVVVGAPGAAPGTVSNTLCGLVDIFPTLADVCGLQPGNQAYGTPGVSLEPALRGVETAGHPTVYCNSWTADNLDCEITGIRRDGDLYFEKIYTSAGPISRTAYYYYDLGADPGERVNLAAAPGYRERRLAAAAEADRIRAVFHARPAAAPAQFEDDRIPRMLKALGYMN